MRNFNIIKDKEFAVLSAMYGIHHFFGSINSDVGKMNKQEIYQIFYGLYQKGILISQNEAIVLKTDMDMIFKHLQQAKQLMSIINPITYENQTFYYSPQENLVVNIQKGWHEPDSIKLRLIEKTDIILVCEQAELFPKQLLNETVLTDIVLDKEVEVLKEYLEVKVYDLVKENQLACISVRMEGFNDVLSYESSQKKYREIYILTHLEALITSLVQEEQR